MDAFSGVIIVGLGLYAAWKKLETLALWEQVCYWEGLHRDLNNSNKQFCRGCGERKLRYYPTYSTNPLDPSKNAPMAECLGCGKCQQICEDNNPYDLDDNIYEELQPYYKMMERQRFIKGKK